MYIMYNIPLDKPTFLVPASRPLSAEVRQFTPETTEPKCYIDFSKNPSIKLDCMDLGGYASRNATASIGTPGTTYSGSSAGSIYPGTISGGTNPFGNTNSFMNPGYNGTNGGVVPLELSWINKLGISLTPKDSFLTGSEYDYNNMAANKYNQVERRVFEREDLIKMV